MLHVQTTEQLHLLLMIVKLCSKSFKVGFSSTWIKKLQMYKLGLKKAEEPEIKLPTFIGSQRKQGNFRKTSTSVSLTMWKSLCGSHKLWKILKEMGISDHITCLLRNLHAGQGAMVEPYMEQRIDWFKIQKGAWQGCILSPCLFNLYAEYIMWNARLMNHKLGSGLLGEISTTSDMQMIPF